MNTNNEKILKNPAARKIIHSLTPFTLLDYPDKIACILWFAGCNMRCSYCYNPDLVYGNAKIGYEEILSFLKKRVNLLDGVVLSGGECMLSKEIFSLVYEIKSMGYCIKIDTNGSKPGKLCNLIERGLIDYVALDFKAPASKMFAITKSFLYSEFLQSLRLLKNSNIAFEVRTTFHSDLLSSFDVKEMIKLLESEGYTGNYYLQAFRNGVETIGDPGYSTFDPEISTFSKNEIKLVVR